jgi:hypothetical protein
MEFQYTKRNGLGKEQSVLHAEDDQGDKNQGCQQRMLTDWPLILGLFIKVLFRRIRILARG